MGNRRQFKANLTANNHDWLTMMAKQRKISLNALIDSLLAEERKLSPVKSTVKVDAKDSCVYVISDRSHYKIGRSSDPKKRCADLSRGNSCELSLVLTIPCTAKNADALEKKLHRFFKDKRVHHEWFALTAVDIEWIKIRYAPNTELGATF